MPKTLSYITALALAGTIALTGCSSSSDNDNNSNDAVTETELRSALTTYADIALKNYEDSLADAKTMQSAITAFTANPTEQTLAAAKAAWKVARVSYGQTEAFRLSNGPIDAEGSWVETKYGALEGQINAWPLDENMIDYTYKNCSIADIATCERTTDGNIINTAGVFTPSGAEATAVDVTTITVNALTELNENGGDANVATGWHAIEFLLWGQDLDNAGREAQAGVRPITDYTTDANAERRKAYLNTVTTKLIADLTTVKEAWNTTVDGDKGYYRAALTGNLPTGDVNNIAATEATKDILIGLGTFIQSELGNERIGVAVLTEDQEEEHSCFSDNTHVDIAENYRGFWNIYAGTYKGQKLGTSFQDLVKKYKAEADTKMVTHYDSISPRITTMSTKAEATADHLHFDQQIDADNPSYRTNIHSMKNTMRDQGNAFVDVAGALGITLTPSDVRDPDENTAGQG